jgi:MFS family permease
MNPQKNHLYFKAILIAVASGGLAFGIVLPVSSVVLESRDVATPLIGLLATMMFAGLALGGPLSGRCIELYGLRRTLSAGLIGTGIALFLLGWWVSLPIWYLVRFLMGCSFACIFTSCETLINRISTGKNRGRNLGLYGLAFSLCLMVGPVGLWLLSFGTWAPFTAAGAVCVCAGLFASGVIPPVQEKTGGVQFGLHFVKRLRCSLTAMAMCGFMEGALIALIPIFTLRAGFTQNESGMLLFFFMLGHGVLTPVIGTIGDRIGLKQVLLFTYGLGAASLALVVCMQPTMRLAPVFLFAGASVGALYPLGVGLLGLLMTPEELPRSNALTTFCYGIGSIAGPFVPALIMHVAPPKSLFVVGAGLYAAAVLLMARWLLCRQKECRS